MLLIYTSNPLFCEIWSQKTIEVANKKKMAHQIVTLSSNFTFEQTQANKKYHYRGFMYVRVPILIFIRFQIHFLY